MEWTLKNVSGAGGIQPIQPDHSKVSDTEKPHQGDSFREVLDKSGKKAETPDVHMSSHAVQRLMQRGITLDASDLGKISAGFDRAAAKGAKESLFLLKDLALVVSVENRTVITALHGENAKENVFTNIDSAILL